jgi:hypothetical protein
MTAAQSSISIWPAVEAITSVFLVLMTGAYAVYTYLLVKNNQRYLEEIRRERHREAVFTLILDAIRPLISEVEDARSEKIVTYSDEKPGLEGIDANINLPDDPYWSELVSENPKLINLYSTIEQHRMNYNRERKELIEECSELLETCVDIMEFGFVDHELSEQELEAVSRPQAKSFAISHLAREDKELTEENIEAAASSFIESVMNRVESKIIQSPNRQEFIKKLTAESSLSKGTAGIVYDWIKLGDPAEREMSREETMYFNEQNVGKYLTDRKSPFSIIAEEMVRNEVKPSNYPYSVTLRNVADFPWIVFPDEMESLAESATQYENALLSFEAELRRVESEYMDQYAIRPVELERK